MALPRRRRGEPLLVLALIVTCWVGLRVATWQTGSAATPSPGVPGPGVPSPGMPGPGTPGFAGAAPVLARIEQPPRSFPRDADGRLPGLREGLPPPVRVTIARPSPLGPEPVPDVLPPVAPGLAGGHAMMWLAAVARMPTPDALLEAVRLAPPPAILAPPTAPRLASAPARGPRWSGDAWALVRGGGGTSAAGPGAATYGGSQVGAVLRYRLAPGNPHRPTAYLRASAALNGSSEREAALGLSIRPLASLPVVIAAEGRVGSFSGKAVARPAVMAVTELPAVSLPGKTRAEFYAQAGYVGGTGATGFADGQLRIDRHIVQAGGIELRAGAGVWGGAQRGAARLDVGPTATLGLAKGSAAARVGLDWRFRLAGAAEPASGPALTVSAGF